MPQLQLVWAPVAPTANAENIPITAANRLRTAQLAHAAARRQLAIATAQHSPDEPAARTAYEESRQQLDRAMDDYRAALRAAHQD